MKYSTFEKIALTVGTVAITGTIVAGYRGEPIVEEIAAQLLLLFVLVGAVHWGRNGGYVTAVAATLVYVIMRIPMLMDEGFTGDVLELILIRTLSFGVIGILGGELCARVKYIFASMADANSLDYVTKVFNERFIGARLSRSLGEHTRYGTDLSVVILILDPGLYLPLRKSKRQQILRQVAALLRNDIRLVDDVGRLDDGRFLLLLPNTPRAGAEIAAERIKSSVRRLLGARDGAVQTQVMGAADDLDELSGLVRTLGVRESVAQEASAS